MKKLFLLSAIIVAALNAFGQTPWANRRDSLLKLLSRSKEDTAKVWTMLHLGNLYMGIKNDSADYYARVFGTLSGKLNYTLGKAYSLCMQAMVLDRRSRPDEAIALDLRAIEMMKGSPQKRSLASLYNNTAIIYGGKGEETTCVDFYLKAETLYEQSNDSADMAMVYGNLANAYVKLGENEKAYTYSLKGILLCRYLNAYGSYGNTMINLANALVNLQRFDTALVVLNQAKEIQKTDHGIMHDPSILALFATAYLGMGKFELVKANAEELSAVARADSNDEAMCHALSGFVDYYFHEKNYQKARRYAREFIQTAKKSKVAIQLLYAYKSAANVEMGMGNTEKYEFYSDLKDSMEDMLRSDKILKNTQELEAKYSLNKKQAEIDNLNNQKKIDQLTLRQRNILNWALVILVIVAVLIGSLYYRTYRQKRKLLLADTLIQEQRITELEKEKQLLAAEAVLQGQVEERTRLAKDLHDGLGSILSGAKYSFTNMKDNLIITPENAEAFERSMGMLDKSIHELRRVAHNMMPEALIKFGLDTALKDFCNSINQSGAVQLTYQSFEINEASIPGTTSAAVYRIIQELVNNILKHADASTALVQLIRNNDALSIAVEDNGKGFDTGILENNTGIGYLNLRNRVTYLNGTIDIQTSPGKGTSVNIEISNLAA